ncbi:TPA: hypothetical protein N0F65_007690 [Lagenidium giganteum]|uniref:Tyrosinase copper-binding domain-containing protein n=1 Tax=Lagenidium giganteum TaxID=4803 RepID=A0AAV2YAN2_9STRA|nr:TPA: hypothetical protein N0F65_007690 [Lagenidium giganteum]
MVNLAHIVVAFTALLASGTPSLAEAGRVRKSWRNFSPQEKQTYKEAVKAAMKSGLHYAFAATHATEPNSDLAHDNCGFLLWHRKFILAYENMLRDQGPQFRSVTLPYWNYFQDHDRHIANGVQCNTILDCSEFLQDLGGLGDRTGDVTVGAIYSDGHCGDDSFAKAACASTDGKSNCGCIPRGPWDSAGQQLAVTSSAPLEAFSVDGDAHNALREAIEGNFHAQVHRELAGAMGANGSPFDPVFYGHHATVDLIHYIHNQCYLADAGPASRGKFKVFGSCSSKNGVPISGDNDIVMKAPTPEAQRYMDAVGSTYASMGDATQLGSNSYSYQLDDYMTALLKSGGIGCAPAGRRLESEAEHDHDDHGHDHTYDGPTYVMTEPVAQIRQALHNCTTELKQQHAELEMSEVYRQVATVECEITRQKLGHDFTDFSDEFLAGMNMSKDMHSYCFQLHQELATKQRQPLVSETCKKRLSELTSTDISSGLVNVYGSSYSPSKRRARR